MNLKRRQLLKTFGIAAITSQLPLTTKSNASRPTILKPPRLKAGDTVGLISPAGAIQAKDIEEISRTLTTLGLKVKLGKHVLERYGYLAGKDVDRAADVNAMFAEKSVQAILTMRGGWGCNRILPLLDYDLIRSHPKILMGFSDVTSLLLAIYAKTGLITFHGLTGTSTWTPFVINSMQRILFDGEALLLQNPININDPPEQSPIQVETITPGKVKGKLIGGNLSVLAAMIGSSYLPNWKNSILFLEEVREEVYRVDRLLTQLKLAGILNQISGFVLGQCIKCDPEEPDKSLTLIQVLQDQILPLRIPAFYGLRIGHIQSRLMLPIGVEVEIDANAGTLKMLESAVE